MNDVIQVMRAYPNIQFRYFIQPSEELPSELIPLYANATNTEFDINLGYFDAINVITKPPNMRALLDNEWV
jgi:hypothetical protein